MRSHSESKAKLNNLKIDEDIYLIGRESSRVNSKTTVSQEKGSMRNLFRIHVHSYLRKNIKDAAVPSMLRKVYFLNIV